LDFVALPALAGGSGLMVGLGLAVLHARIGGRAGAPTMGSTALFALAGMVAAAWAVVAATSPLQGLLGALLGWQLLLIAAVDAAHFWLPDRLTFPLLGSGLVAAALLGPDAVLNALTGALLGFAGLWLIARAYRVLRGREGLGGGDPFLLAAGGAWVGWIGLPSVLLWSAAAGLSVVLAMRLTGRAVAADTRLPFGVFLAAGIWMTWIFGPLGFSR
jgi:leader peptidase (prepilin peptidase)/N-methyltransferase